MKILICLGRLYMGGIEKYAMDLALGMKNKGHNVSVLVFYSIRNEEKRILLDNNGIKVYELNLHSGKDLRLPIKLYQIIKLIKPDIIHLNILPLLAFIALVFSKSKKVYTIHQITTNKTLSEIYKFFIDGVIAISDNIKNIFLSELNLFPRSKWVVINNGINAVSEKVLFPENKIVNLIMTARLAQDKHPDDAIDIVNYLIVNSALNYNLLLVGDGDVDDNFFLESLNQKVNEYGIADKVYFKGWREDVMPFLLESHGFLMLSRLECFPYSVIEALSVGIPIFSYNIRGGLQDMHENNQTGIVIDGRDSIELAKEIDIVFNNPDKWQKFSENAFTKSKDFTIQQMVDKTEDFYMQLINKKA